MNELDSVLWAMERLHGRTKCEAGCAPGDDVAVCSVCLGHAALATLRSMKARAVEGYALYGRHRPDKLFAWTPAAPRPGTPTDVSPALLIPEAKP